MSDPHKHACVCLESHAYACMLAFGAALKIFSRRVRSSDITDEALLAVQSGTNVAKSINCHVTAREGVVDW